MENIKISQQQCFDLIRETQPQAKYYALFQDNEEFFDDEIRWSISRTNGNSPSSLQFSDACQDKSSAPNEREKNQCRALQRIFGIEDASFIDRYHEAIHGGGSEGNEINRLHSSALLPLLCFYKVIGSKLVLPKELAHITFQKSEFEHKNALSFTKASHSTESNIDVTLFDGEKLEDSQNVLFLESKFKEYLTPGKAIEISIEGYQDFYSSIKATLTALNVKYDRYYQKNKEKSFFEIQAINGKNHVYYEGLKQMISHFMGACTYAREHDQEVYLGEILYNFTFSSKFQFELQKYLVLYAGLAQALDIYPDKPKNLHVLPQCLTYQEVFKGYPLDTYVKAFYKL